MPLIDEPQDVLITADGDWDLASGMSFTSGLAGVSQGIRVRLQTFRGEWFLDENIGVPWLANDAVDVSEAILGQKYNEPATREALRRVILSAPGVAEIVDLTLVLSAARLLTVTWRVRTVFGDTITETFEQGV